MVDNRLKGDVRMYDIDVIVDEILIGIWWALHDTGIYVPSRDDNCSIGQSTVICTGDPFSVWLDRGW